MRGRTRIRAFSSRSGRPARGMDWGGYDVAGVTTPGAANASRAWALSPSDLRTFYTDPTIMFSRVIWNARTTGLSPAAPTLGAIAVGLIKMTGDPDSATLPASGTFPTPYDDPEADWLYHWVYPLAPSTPSGALISQIGDERAAHSRARRRMGNDSGLLLVIESAGIAIDFNVNVRYLLKE